MMRIIYFLVVVVFWIHLPLPVALALFIIGGLIFPWYIEGVISAFLIDFYLINPLAGAWWWPYFIFTILIILLILGRKLLLTYILRYN
ncbi:MAG: hypothetical protein WDZ73_01725 [Candidatus Paceibacterota bacterium]